MTQQTQTPSRELCPHLAAASLWMSQTTRIVRRSGKPRIRYARAFGPAVDDLLAL
jgi:hypothetical protein